MLHFRQSSPGFIPGDFTIVVSIETVEELFGEVFVSLLSEFLGFKVSSNCAHSKETGPFLGVKRSVVVQIGSLEDFF
jgi:hypothetical protein